MDIPLEGEEFDEAYPVIDVSDDSIHPRPVPDDPSSERVVEAPAVWRAPEDAEPTEGAENASGEATEDA